MFKLLILLQLFIDPPCMPMLKYSAEVLEAKKSGVTEEEFNSNIITRLESPWATNAPISYAKDLLIIFDFVYKSNTENDEQLVLMFNRVNGYCTHGLFMTKEELRNLDTDQDGHPDYDNQGKPIEDVEI